MKPIRIRRKPLVFEAVRWSDALETRHVVEAWARASGQGIRYDQSNGNLLITTKEGGVCAVPGSYIVRDDKGEIYPLLARRVQDLYDVLPDEAATTR